MLQSAPHPSGSADHNTGFSIHDAQRLIRLPEVRYKTGLSTSTLYKYMAEGTFPKPVRIGVRTVAWPEKVINDWIAERLNESTRGSAA